MLPSPAAAHTCCPLLQRRLACIQPSSSSVRSSGRHRIHTRAAAHSRCRHTAHLHTSSRCTRPAIAAHAAATDTAEQTVPDSRQQLDDETETQAKEQAEADFASFKDVDRPRWHITAPRGWVNDPNAPLLHDGTYHLFFQHLPDRIEWEFGICWGHVSSRDLVRWAWLPVALEPTPGGYDADGCFSGSALLDKDGIPTILYTGVRLRNNPNAPPPPDEAFDLGLPFIETQLCAAHADPKKDPLLKHWTKDEAAPIELPPSELHPANTLMGWRDPFIFELPSEDNNHEYGMLMGNGIKDKGGCILVYRSKELNSGWYYAGTLCEGRKEDSGSMWECPILLPLKPDPESSDGQPDAIIGSRDTCHAEDYTHVLFVSPDAPSQPVLYYLGQYKDGKFLMDKADGPFRLDLGDAPYAPNTLVNDDGRHLMWVWLQEHPSRLDDNYNYAGCMSAPRELHIRQGRLVQKPLQELASLHGRHIFSQEEPVELHSKQLWHIPECTTTSMDMRFELHPGTASTAGLAVLDCCGEGRPRSAALVYNWDDDQLEVAFNTYLIHPDNQTFSLATEEESDDAVEETNRHKPRRIGGKLGWCKEAPLRVRVLFDGSSVEVFAGLSHDDVARGVLSTRIYRGRSTQPGLAFFAVDGSASVSKIDIHEMQQCWTDREEVEALAAKPCSKCDRPTRPAEKAVDMPYGEVTAGRCKQCLGLHRPGECPLEGDGKVVHPYGQGNNQ